MNQTAANVAYEAKKPEHDQDDNLVQSMDNPFGLVESSLLFYREAMYLATFSDH